MKTTLRFNEIEMTVEDVTASSKEFNDALAAEMIRIFGHDRVVVTPSKFFKDEEHTDNNFMGIVTGQLEGEAPISIKVLDEKMEEVLISFPAFISFRK